MKYLVLLVVIAVAVGIWRSRRAPDAAARKAPYAPPALPQDMLACAHCGVHFHFMCRERWYRERG